MASQREDSKIFRDRVQLGALERECEISINVKVKASSFYRDTKEKVELGKLRGAKGRTFWSARSVPLYLPRATGGRELCMVRRGPGGKK